MKIRRLVVEEGALHPGEVRLDEDQASHVRDVLRLDEGEQIVLADGAGKEALALLRVVSRREVRAVVGEIQARPEPEGIRLTLIQCVGKGDKMDLVVRQATELGASAIVPVLSARSIAKKEARLDRWRKIADEAVRVSGRAFRPIIEPVTPFARCLARPRAALALCLALGSGPSLGAHLASSKSEPATGELLIGPEGGLTEEEIAAASSAGFAAVQLGEYTLRTETAGTAAVAILLHWGGALGW